MKREDLYFVLFAQQTEFWEDNTLLFKRRVMERIISLISLKMPIIITGVRRCGKSSLLRLVKEELKLKEKEYVYINFNDERFVDFLVEDFQKILDFITEQNYKEDCFLFIDEIQEVDKWEKWIDRIKNKYKIIITGSNSKLLSKEISTIMTGRSININLTPFDFQEFLDVKKIDLLNFKLNLNIQAKVRRELKEYLEIGGFPKRVISGQQLIIQELYENILYRDIIGRFSKNQKQIKEISVYFLSNISSLISLRGISRLVEIKNISSVKNIIDCFENAFLFFFLNKFDYSTKKQILNPKKIYCVDNGFITSLGFKFSSDKGKLLENLVAIELKRRNEEIYYYSDKNDCDFVLKEKTKIKEVIQVCYDLNEKNKKRELDGLLEALNKFNLKEGLILTYDQEDELVIEGKKIIIKPIWKWLISI